MSDISLSDELDIFESGRHSRKSTILTTVKKIFKKNC